MKIIYFHQYFNTPQMSGGTRSYEMARRLVEKGHTVHMITTWRDKNRPNGDWFKTEEAGIKVHWLPVPYSNRMSYSDRLKAFLRFAFAAGKKAMSLEGDVVFATSTPLTIAIPAVRVCKRKKIPFVFEVRDLWPELPIAIGALSNPLMRFAAKKLEAWAYQNSDSIVALSPGMKSGIVETGYPADRVAVIPNSSDNSEFKYSAESAQRFRDERPWLGTRPLIVYTGTFGKINNVGYMAELASELRHIDPEIRVLLIGGGQKLDEVVQKARSMGVFETNLFIEDRIPKKEIPVALSAADMASSVTIDLPELQPNSANKFFDALASSTPIVINYGGWQKELIESTGCGVVLWRLSMWEAAQKVAMHIRDEEWLMEAGGAARRLAETHFDRDKLAQELEAVIMHAVEGRSSEARRISPGNFDSQIGA